MELHMLKERYKLRKLSADAGVSYYMLRSAVLGRRCMDLADALRVMLAVGEWVDSLVSADDDAVYQRAAKIAGKRDL